MNDFDDMSRKASQTAEKNREAAEETVRGAKQSYSATFDNIRNLNVKLIDEVQANSETVRTLARDIARRASRRRPIS